jgi:hypothetical protein
VVVGAGIAWGVWRQSGRQPEPEAYPEIPSAVEPGGRGAVL